MSSSFEGLQRHIDHLYVTGQYHKKRGFQINASTPNGIAIHLVEEAVEVADAVIHNDLQHAIGELADLTLLMAHLTMRLDIPWQTVIELAHAKLSENWVVDSSGVTAITPGFTRRGRA